MKGFDSDTYIFQQGVDRLYNTILPRKQAAKGVGIQAIPISLVFNLKVKGISLEFKSPSLR